MRAIVVSTVLALTLLSLWWTTFKSRQIMSRSLGRKLKAGEETSLRSWMEICRSRPGDRNHRTGAQSI